MVVSNAAVRARVQPASMLPRTRDKSVELSEGSYLSASVQLRHHCWVARVTVEHTPDLTVGGVRPAIALQGQLVIVVDLLRRLVNPLPILGGNDTSGDHVVEIVGAPVGQVAVAAAQELHL